MNKMVILVDVNNEKVKELSDLADPFGVKTIYSYVYPEELEIEVVLSNIDMIASSSTKNILLVHYSGRESVHRLVGDIRSEMIITLSANEESPHFISDLDSTFISTLKLL